MNDQPKIFKSVDEEYDVYVVFPPTWNTKKSSNWCNFQFGKNIVSHSYWRYGGFEKVKGSRILRMVDCFGQLKQDPDEKRLFLKLKEIEKVARSSAKHFKSAMKTKE